MAFVFAHLLSLVSFVLALLLVARVGEQRRQTGSLVAWLIAILLVPYVGVPLYFFLGGRKLHSRAAAKGMLPAAPSRPTQSDTGLATMLSASGAPAPTRGNQLALLGTGEVAFAEILQLVQSARSRVHIATLIFADDEVGRALAGLLAEQARKGVVVRVLVDALFKFRSSRALVAELAAAGVKVGWFMPIWGFLPRRSANLRLHRKMVLVDGAHAIVGGMNLASEYMGPAPRAGRWRDLSVTVRGPAVADIERIFESDWLFAAGEAIARQSLEHLATEPSPDAAPSAPNGTDTVQVVGSGPDVAADRIYDALLSVAFAARRRLWISTPYFVPDEALQRALALAVRRGVDVRVVVPRRSNHLTADLAGASYLRELARAGASIRCYTPEMLHAKLVLADDDLVILGSANMDMRSLFLNYELALVVSSAANAAELAAWMETVLARCVDLAPASRGRALLESVARLLAPLE
jgi:cardiolipin synthase A/B